MQCPICDCDRIDYDGHTARCTACKYEWAPRDVKGLNDAGIEMVAIRLYERSNAQRTPRPATWDELTPETRDELRQLTRETVADVIRALGVSHRGT